MAKRKWHAHRDSLGPQRRVCQWSFVESGRSMHVRFSRRWPKNQNVSRQVSFLFLFFSFLSSFLVFTQCLISIRNGKKMVERRHNDEPKTEIQQSIDPAAIQQWWQIIIWVLRKHKHNWAVKNQMKSLHLLSRSSFHPFILFLFFFFIFSLHVKHLSMHGERQAGRQQHNQTTQAFTSGAQLFPSIVTNTKARLLEWFVRYSY